MAFGIESGARTSTPLKNPFVSGRNQIPEESAKVSPAVKDQQQIQYYRALVGGLAGTASTEELKKAVSVMGTQLKSEFSTTDIGSLLSQIDKQEKVYYAKLQGVLNPVLDENGEIKNLPEKLKESSEVEKIVEKAEIENKAAEATSNMIVKADALSIAYKQASTPEERAKLAAQVATYVSGLSDKEKQSFWQNMADNIGEDWKELKDQVDTIIDAVKDGAAYVAGKVKSGFLAVVNFVTGANSSASENETANTATIEDPAMAAPEAKRKGSLDIARA